MNQDQHNTAIEMTGSLKSILRYLLDFPLRLLSFLLLVYVILSWLIGPDCILEFNRTAVWTHQTLRDFFEPAFRQIRPILPNHGFIESENSPLLIDYSVILGFVGIEVLRRFIRRLLASK